ncbi:MAG: hypothetical protein P4M08_15715 [Oligoflexia bacterium]|nr:hypothetical protein [Oligoflexia bacterium]
MLLKKVVWASFFIGMIGAGSAFAAAPGTSNAPANDDRDDYRFECHFRCDGFGKGVDRDRCEAEGQLDQRKLHDNEWVLGDRDDYLRLRCDDDRDNQGFDDEKNGILYGRRFDDLLISKDKTTSPIIVVEGSRRLEGEHAAKIIIHRDEDLQKGGDVQKIEGVCVFTKREDGGGQPPAPATPPSITPSVLK